MTDTLQRAYRLIADLDTRDELSGDYATYVAETVRAIEDEGLDAAALYVRAWIANETLANYQWKNRY